MLAAAVSAAACTRPFFQPEPGLRWTPAELGLAYEDVWFRSGDGESLHGWLLRVPAAQQPSPTIVFLHGNAENASTHLGSVAWLPAHGFQIFLFDYRGFGLSTGTPDIPGALLDAEAALALAPRLDGVDPTRIAVFGQSIGGALALCAAARVAETTSLRAVLVDSAPSDWRSVAREALQQSALTRPLATPLAWLVPTRPSPLDAVRALRGRPMLFVVGAEDAIVAPHHGRRLAAAAGPEAELWEVPGVPHIGAFERPEWRSRLVAYLKRVMSGAEPGSMVHAGRTPNGSVILVRSLAEGSESDRSSGFGPP